VPQAVALADPTYAAIAPAATIQVAASVIVTAILTPLLTSWWFRNVAVARRRTVIAEARHTETVRLEETASTATGLRMEDR
jgi:hypothetical protein